MEYKSKWEKNPWKPKKIIYEPTDEKLTASAGLGPLTDAFMQSPEFSAFKACLPERIGNSSYSAEHLALIILCGFWYGHDCLDDLEEFEEDPAVEDKLGGLATSKTIGNYLRDFAPEHIEKLRRFMTKQAFHYRTRIDGEKTSITFDQDSTFSANGADEMILRVMDGIPNRLEVQHYYRGDSAVRA